jgi:hypothetical protein
VALLAFPLTPFNGQVYPTGAPAGTTIYQWDALNQTWTIIGQSTGVVAGTYGSPTAIPRFIVNDSGELTFAENVTIAAATPFTTGVVQIGSNINVNSSGVVSVPDASSTVKGVAALVNNTATNDNGKALTAAAGYNLQQQLNTLTAQVAALSTAIQNAQFAFFDDFSSQFNGVLTTFMLEIGGSAVAPNPTTNILVFLGGVPQIAGEAYTVVGSAIQFVEAPVAGTNCSVVTIEI